MSTLGLRLPIDIPWKRIGVSTHMMDPEVCDKVRPVVMQPSVAVFSYEPDDSLDIGDPEYKVSYLKVTCSITSFGATNLDRLRLGRLIVTSPHYGMLFSNSSYEARRSDQFDSKQHLSGADLPCFGALIEVSVGPSSGDWAIHEYPYFSDFDPKKRELYELVSETGEIMSRSLESAGVLHGGTTSSSNEVFDKDTWGVKGGVTVPAGDAKISAEANYANESGTRSVDSAAFTNVRTVDAGREARETFSHTTQLSQMYQLLASFHLGTNRAVFFLEPRPHIVQRDRTLIDGPRQLEGIQEFFLVVVRPRKMEAICVSASLETLHVGTIVDTGEPPAGPTADLSLPRLGLDGAWQDPDKDKTFPSEDSVTYKAPPGYLIDQFKGAGGYRVDKLDSAGNAKHKIEVTSTTVTIWGRVEEHHIEGDIFEQDRRDSGHLEVSITIYLKAEAPAAPNTTQFAILTETSVCTCPQRVQIERVKASNSVVREFLLPKTDVPVGRPMPVELARDWNKYLGREVRQSMSSPDRYPRGAVTFWDLDIMKDPLADVARGRRFQGLTVGALFEGVDLEHLGLDQPAREFLQRRDVLKQGVRELLKQPLRQFVDDTGLDFESAAKVRRSLWDRTTAASNSSPRQASKRAR